MTPNLLTHAPKPNYISKKEDWHLILLKYLFSSIDSIKASSDSVGIINMHLLHYNSVHPFSPPILPIDNSLEFEEANKTPRQLRIFQLVQSIVCMLQHKQKYFPFPPYVGLLRKKKRKRKLPWMAKFLLDLTP